MRHYFAYGSNLTETRMDHRVPGSQLLGMAHLDGYRVLCNKVGLDGSAKANLATHAVGRVWGALYEMTPAGFDLLDPFEDGYVRLEVEVIRPTLGTCVAVTYQSSVLTDDPVPFDWYRGLIVDGAREIGLPPDYIAQLEELPSRRDPEGRTR